MPRYIPWGRASSNVRILALALSLATAGTGAFAGESYGKIVLKSGEVIQGDIARTVGDLHIVRTPDGLRMIPKDSVQRVDPSAGGSASPPSPIRPQPPARGTPPGPDPKKASSKNDPEKAVPSGQKEDAEASELKILLEAPDKKLDEARSSGSTPVLEISLSGTIDGKPLNSGDAFAISKLTFFFAEDSSPRFQVLPPQPAKADKAGPKGNVEKGGVRPAKQPDYLARLEVNTAPIDVTFYNMPLQKKIRSRCAFRLARVSDKKPVVEIEATEDEDVIGELKDNPDAFRNAYQHAVIKLLEHLRSLKTFGGPSSGTANHEPSAKLNRR